MSSRSAIGLATALVFGIAGGALAQSTQNYSSGNMWGTTPTGVAVPGMLDSAVAHSHNGNIAGQVNAARKDLLLSGGPGMSITSIGSQTIVSTTVMGDNNNTNVNATQSSSNSGSVSNTGVFNK